MCDCLFCGGFLSRHCHCARAFAKSCALFPRRRRLATYYSPTHTHDDVTVLLFMQLAAGAHCDREFIHDKHSHTDSEQTTHERGFAFDWMWRALAVESSERLFPIAGDESARAGGAMRWRWKSTINCVRRVCTRHWEARLCVECRGNYDGDRALECTQCRREHRECARARAWKLDRICVRSLGPKDR